MKKRVLAIFLVTSMIFSLAACGSSGNETSKETTRDSTKASTADSDSDNTGKSEKTVVTIGLNGTVTGVAPFSAPDVPEYPIENTMYQRLFTTSGISSQELIPVIGESYEMIDDQTVQIKIFDYVHDTDGNPVKASDVVFSYETCKQAATQTDTAFIESIKAIDEVTIEMKLTEPNQATVVKLLNHINIVSQAAYEANQDTCPGTSAYKLISYTSGSEYVFEKVDDYWQTDASKDAFDQAANVDKIVFQCIPEKTQMTIALESGQIQMAIDCDGREAARFEEGGANADGFAVSTNAGSFSNLLLFNDSESSLCHDVNLRKAICYAVSREAIIDLVLNGAGKVAKDLASDVLGGYNEEWLVEDYFDYSTEKAKEFLAMSSYNGETLRLESSAGNSAILELMQSQLGEVGIKVDIQTFETALWSEEKVAGTGESNWDLSVDGVGGSLVTSAYKVKFNPDNFSTGLPQTGTADTKVVELCLKAAQTNAVADIEAFHDYVVEQAYAIGLYSPAAKCVMVNTISDICYNYMGYVVPGASNFDNYTITK